MSERYVTHDTMVLERTYPADPQKVFHAWTDARAKRAWFLGEADEDASSTQYELDFRVDGREFCRSGAPDGAVYTYVARYDDIVPDERIVYTNFMLRGETRISVSLTTVEFHQSGSGTKLVLTEHGVYLDGEDQPEYRTQGIEHQLDALGAALGSAATADVTS
ncbi:MULTISPECIES: SRPBCC family protein [Humibacter]